MLTDSLWSCNGKDPHHDQVQPEEPPARVGQNRLHPPEAVPALSPLRYHPAALSTRTPNSSRAPPGGTKRALACVHLVDGHPCIKARPLDRSVRTEHQGLRSPSLQPAAMALASFVIWVIGSIGPPSACRGRSSPLYF